MTTFTVSFFGHRVIDDPLRYEQQLEIIVRRLLHDNEYVEFLVGRDGEFDQIVSSTIHRCKRLVRDDNSNLVWVLPYYTAEYRENERFFWDYYDEIEVCNASTATHYKNAHKTRNREMVDRSNLVVFCLQHESGGAWQTMKYTKRRGVPYINIADQKEE